MQVVGELEGGSQDAASRGSSPVGQVKGGADGTCEEADARGGREFRDMEDPLPRGGG